MAKPTSTTYIPLAKTTRIKAGDVVVCINDAPCCCLNCRAGMGDARWPHKKGDILRVAAVVRDETGPGLIFTDNVDWPGHKPDTNPARYRKVKKATADFTAMLRNMRPAQTKQTETAWLTDAVAARMDEIVQNMQEGR